MLAGYENIDAKTGGQIYPLPYLDNSVEEIRASHVLEHFPHAQVPQVLADWTRALAPGGLLKVAVPDFPSIAQGYLTHRDEPTQGYLMGGQVDAYDFHKSIFNFDTLSTLMREAGCVAINAWESELDDCARLPISLNLSGYKRPTTWPRVHAIMSVPRLGFMDAFFSWWEALSPLKIPLQKFTGAFWGQCLERGFDQVLKESAPEFILTLDYDTVFDREVIEDMLMLMLAHPEVDALAPMQASRSKSSAMFCIRGADGHNIGQLPSDHFDAPVVKAHTAHFGCTLIRTRSLGALPKPWFHSRPDASGAWGDGHEDEDIYFWLRFAEHGRALYIAPRAVVGHLELMIRWPNERLEPLHQHPSDYNENGRPEGVWQ